MEQDFEKIIADFESETGYILEIIDGRPTNHITGASSTYMARAERDNVCRELYLANKKIDSLEVGR